MTPADRLYAIVEQGLCIGCGLCQVVAGREVVEIVTTSEAALRPLVVGELSGAVVDTIYDVCPGTRVDGLDPSLLDGAEVDPVWGPWRRMVLAWAADPVIRHEGSTGGVLTALAQYLLRSGRVAAVLHTRASDTEPTFGQATLSRTEAEVLAAAGSRYGPTATLVGVDAVLAAGEPLAFVGKPCDVAALRAWGRHDARVGELVRYWLAPICGGYGPTSFTDRFLTGIGLERGELTAFRYRGRGCPGPTVAETAEAKIERHYLDYWGEDESSWELPWRCKLCPDGIGESCDLVAGDTWPGGSPVREETADDRGTNAVIARTEVGAELLAAAAADGALALGEDLTPDHLTGYQPHQADKKHVVADRYRGLADEGWIVPVTRHLRLDELAAVVPVEIRQRQRAGTRHRVRAGRASEPRPPSRSGPQASAGSLSTSML